ncbi:hypothetical protein [Pectinatus sottacetonis]|uniref:hypothetical protein n=1 Tax=Pectinatus sottacetonis TaxID=1002795 RepID=UPI0018C66F63|nr:hypothetical protein [Pectinatus sottacetonis]
MKKHIPIALILSIISIANFNHVSAAMAPKDLKITLDGVESYYSDPDTLNTYAPPSVFKDRKTKNYFDNYTRLGIKYKIDDTNYIVTRIHSGYDEEGNAAPNTNDNGAYFDQAYLKHIDRKNNMTYIIGKTGAYLGQGMVYNSSGNLNGGSITYGAYWKPTCISAYYGNKNGGQTLKALNIDKEVAPNIRATATYINYKIPISKINNYVTDNIYDIGINAKLHNVTLVSEYAYNSKTEPVKTPYMGDKYKGYYVELYTGPTTDMTGEMPLQKIGTQVFSLRYQNIGDYSSISPTVGFYPGYKGWRFDFGRTIAKGISADIAYYRMQKKGPEYNTNFVSGKNKNLIVGEIAYKF